LWTSSIGWSELFLRDLKEYVSSSTNLKIGTDPISETLLFRIQDVGFANLPNQVYRKEIKKGFDFTLMVVGKFWTILFLQITYIRYLLLHLPVHAVLISTASVV
jgi:hypothetical protein